MMMHKDASSPATRLAQGWEWEVHFTNLQSLDVLLLAVAGKLRRLPVLYEPLLLLDHLQFLARQRLRVLLEETRRVVFGPQRHGAVVRVCSRFHALW